MWANITCFNIQIMSLPEKEKEKKNKLMAENFTNLIKSLTCT